MRTTIILLRLRNLAIFALVVLSVSFIYIGYSGFYEGGDLLKQADNLLEEQDEIPEYLPILANIEDVENADNFFVDFRMKRDRARAMQIEPMKDTVNNPNSSKEAINRAQDKLFAISENIAAEANAEILLGAKGYEQSVVLAEGENISVFVKKDNLTQADITRISDLVIRATGYKLEQIVITPKN